MKDKQEEHQEKVLVPSIRVSEADFLIGCFQKQGLVGSNGQGVKLLRAK